MNEFSENIGEAVYCKECGEKHPTNFIEPRPNTLVVCPNCGHKYFPFGKSVDELEEPPDLGI